MAKVTISQIKGTKDIVVTEIGVVFKKRITTTYYDYEIHCRERRCGKWTLSHVTPHQAEALRVQHKESHNTGQLAPGRGGDDKVVGTSQKPRVRPDVVHGHRCSRCGSTILTCIRDDVPHVVSCSRCTTKEQTMYMDEWII